ncbi:MAG: hypothetical protein Q8941_09410 [Bacteroidota bacterium]|nr:hypothetical protein [Bacteroidota bacterium]
MAQRVFCFVVVLIFFFNGEIFSQGKPVLLKPPINNNTQINFDFEKSLQLKYKPKGSVIFQSTIKYDSVKMVAHQPLFALSGPVLAPSYYSCNLGFFCKKELQLEKITSVPVRLRLGSLAYVNYLEQKPGALKPQP